MVFISGVTLGMGASEFLAQTGHRLLEKLNHPGFRGGCLI